MGGGTFAKGAGKVILGGRRPPPEALAPFVPRLVAAWAGSDRAGANRHRSDGTLVSVDISGFTALSERLAARGKLGAEELIDQITRSTAS